MSAEWFAKLKEFDSLTKMKSSDQKLIREQDERLEKLARIRESHLEGVALLKDEHSKLQQLYFEAEKKMNSSEEQASRLRDVGGDQDKIAKLLAEAADLENSLFAMLERTEAIQSELAEKKTFLAGLEKTYLEIQEETAEEVSRLRTNIGQADRRLELIQVELPADFRNLLEKTLKKDLAIGPFTRIDAGSCYFCRYKISRIEESEIDMHKALKVCPQCTRIFLPYGS